MLEKAKRQHGGSRRVDLYDCHGDGINPKGMTEGSTCREKFCWDWVAFSEDAVP